MAFFTFPFSHSPLIPALVLIFPVILITTLVPIDGGDARHHLGQGGLVLLGGCEPVPLLRAVRKLQPDGAPSQQTQADTYARAR